MKILKLTPYYSPERISSSHLSHDLENAFINAGCEIEVYTPTPTRGITAEERGKYKKIKYEEKYGGKIKIHRFSMFSEGNNPIMRALRYALCHSIQKHYGKKAKNASVIMASSTPPTQGLMIAKVKKKLNVPFVYMLQDVFPDSLVNAGMAKKGSLIWKIGRRMENKIYAAADKIIVISDDIKNNILEKGVPEEKIAVISNWVDTSEVQPVKRADNKLFDEFGIDRNGFYITYAGNLGNAQGIDVIISAAEALKDNCNIRFIIIGNGTQEDEYKKAANDKQLANLSFFPMQPKERISEVYSLGNASIVACKKGHGKCAMPSKTWSIMSAGTPILASFDIDSELCHMIEQNKCGICAEASDANALANAVIEIYNNAHLYSEYGSNGLNYVKTNADTAVCTQKYVDIIKEVCKNYVPRVR